MRLNVLAVVLSIAVVVVAAGREDKKPRPKTGGTENDPLVQLELAGLDGDDRADVLLASLNELPWASRTAVLPRHPGSIAKDRVHPKATAVLALGERQWADVADLAIRLRKAGFTVSAIHLTHFGTVRIRTQLGTLSGDTIESTEGTKKRTVLAPTNPARLGIEAVFRKAPWLIDAKFPASGTKPDFNLAPKAEVRAEFVLDDSQVIELGTLLDGLNEAGFPPQAMRVARMSAGVPFGFPIPGDVDLIDAAGTKLPSGQLQTSGRPLVLVCFSLTGTYKQGKDEKAYRAEPVHFSGLKEVAKQFADRVDFAAISSPKGDSTADVTALWERAAMPFPVYRDPEQKLATALSAGLVHPPPHIFILDAAGKLRYAGEFADGWVEPEKIKRVYLVEALERVLAKQYADNGAVFNNSPPCSCSAAGCKCPKCGCGGPCRCGCSTGAG